MLFLQTLIICIGVIFAVFIVRFTFGSRSCGCFIHKWKSIKKYKSEFGTFRKCYSCGSVEELFEDPEWGGWLPKGRDKTKKREGKNNDTK